MSKRKREDTKNLLVNSRRSKCSYFGRVGKEPSAYGFTYKENVESPISKFIDAFTPSPNRRPLQQTSTNTAVTPHGTRMKAYTEIGPFRCYRADLTTTPQRTNTHPALKSNNAEEIKNQLAPSITKKISASFNLQDIKRVNTQKKKQGNQRKISQGRVVSSTSRIASATKIAKKYGITSAKYQRFEWTHLIAYRFLGEKGQAPKNLILATKECNSLMMIFEEAVSDLCKILQKKESKLTLNVSADTIPGTHIGTCIHYHIVSEELNLDLKVKFDPQLTVKPTKNLEGIVHRLLKYALDANEPVCFNTPPSPKTKSLSGEDGIQDSPIKPMKLSF